MPGREIDSPPCWFAFEECAMVEVGETIACDVCEDDDIAVFGRGGGGI